MGSSAKRKKEKKKDFQKPKLRVGKAAPKAANATSTSFKAQKLLINQQINANAPSQNEQYLHHVSLLGSRADSQRKESLAYLASAIQGDSRGRASPLPTKDLLDKVMPLLLDSSSGVRSEMLKAFRALRKRDLGDYAETVLPYIRAGMTHLSQDIRRNTMDVLAHFVASSGKALVSAPGGWIKTLQCFTNNLGFKDFPENEAWSLHKTGFREDAKSVAKTLQVTELFLNAGLLEDFSEGKENYDPAHDFPLYDFAHHQISAKSNRYGYLNLFGKPLDNDSRQLEDREERVLEFRDRFQARFTKSLASARQEGGEVGRSAGQILKIIERACKEE